jgi:hypothetical protein
VGPAPPSPRHDAQRLLRRSATFPRVTSTTSRSWWTDKRGPVKFCRILEDSKVAAFGITDYFSLDGFFTVAEEYAVRYPKSRKVLFPNLELRLTESVNQSPSDHRFPPHSQA